MTDTNRFWSLCAALMLLGCDLTPPNLSGVLPPTGGGATALASSDETDAPKDDDSAGSTDQAMNESELDEATAESAAPGEPALPPECKADLEVNFDVTLHTLFVNNSLLVDGMFTWQASGASGLLVDLEFKTNSSDWVTLAADLPSSDVKTLDLSQHVGPSSSWHFRALTWHPACPENLSYSDITTIQN